MVKANPQLLQKLDEILKDNDTKEWVNSLSSESCKLNYPKHVAEYHDYLGDLDALIGGVFESLQPSPPEINKLEIHPLLKNSKEIGSHVPIIVSDDAQIATTVAKKRKNEKTFYTVIIESDDSKSHF